MMTSPINSFDPPPFLPSPPLHKLFGSNYGKLFENQTRLIGQAKTNPQTVTWLEKLTAYTKSSKKRFLQEKFSRTRHNRTLHFAYAMTNLKIYLCSRAQHAVSYCLLNIPPPHTGR